MKSQDDKEQHQIRCKGVLRGEGVGAVAFTFSCSCGREWEREAVDAPFFVSLVACECGAKAGFDIRSGRQRAIDDGGAP